jgi:hypothetical protein
VINDVNSAKDKQEPKHDGQGKDKEKDKQESKHDGECKDGHQHHCQGVRRSVRESRSVWTTDRFKNFAALCEVRGCGVKGPHMAHGVYGDIFMASDFPTEEVEVDTIFATAMKVEAFRDEVVDMFLSAESLLSDDPTTYKEAMGSPHAEEWCGSVKKEWESQLANNTFTIIPKPRGKNIMRVKWVFKTKRNERNEIVRYKARLCGKGFSQKEGQDYFDVFAPVARVTTIRSLLALAAVNDWELDNMDVVTAFLQSEVEEEIYIELPEGYKERGPNGEEMVGKLNKSLYGIKQAARNWNKAIHEWFISNGFKASDADPCLYVRHGSDGSILAVILYVDDLIIAGSSRAVVDAFKRDISSRFEMQDLGALKYVLGMEVKRDRANKTLEINQTAYVDRVLARFGMSNCSPVATPATGILQSVPRDEAGPDPEYMAMVGCLVYLSTMTRPDMAFAVQALGKHMAATGPEHVKAAKRALRYVKGTRELGLRFGGEKDFPTEIIGRADSDWGADVDTRRSITGYVFTVGGGVISYNSKRQPTVALSSTEAEYMAACNATQEAMHLRVLLRDLGFEQNGPTIIMEDNQGCIALSENPINHRRTKHIDVRYHYTRERVEAGAVKLVYVPTEWQLADLLTKPLEAPRLAKLRKLLMEGPMVEKA